MKRDINDIIHDKLIGNISSEDEKRLQEWLHSDPAHQQQYDDLFDADDLSAQYLLYEQTDVKGSWQKFCRDHHWQSPASRWRKVCLYAASAAVLLVGRWIYYQRSIQPIRPTLSQEVAVAIKKAEVAGKNQAILTLPDGKQIVVASDSAAQVAIANLDKDVTYHISTKHGKEFWITLADGTRIHMNSNTLLDCPVQFTSSDRSVYLIGDAYFYVAQDKHRPFMVKTDNGIVKEYGTSFNANTTDQPGTTKVVLVEGSISVITRSGNEHAVKPHQLAEIHHESDNVNIQQTDVKPYTAWNEGRFVFEECPMQQLMEVLAQWYNMKVAFKNDRSKDIHFTGTLDKYGNADDILRAIESVAGVKIVHHGNTVEID